MPSNPFILEEISRMKKKYSSVYNGSTFALGFNHTLKRIESDMISGRTLTLILNDLDHDAEYNDGVKKAVELIKGISHTH